jgi:hypothetical protein
MSKVAVEVKAKIKPKSIVNKMYVPLCFASTTWPGLWAYMLEASRQNKLAKSRYVHCCGHLIITIHDYILELRSMFCRRHIYMRKGMDRKSWSKMCHKLGLGGGGKTHFSRIIVATLTPWGRQQETEPSAPVFYLRLVAM